MEHGLSVGRHWSLLWLMLGFHVAGWGQPHLQIDLARIDAAPDVLTRVYGSVGNGARGVPVAGGKDLDGDGFPDLAFAAMQASQGRSDFAPEGLKPLITLLVSRLNACPH